MQPPVRVSREAATRRVQATHSRRRLGDTARLQRRPEPLGHESALRLLRVPDLEDDPAPGLCSACVEQQAGRPVAAAGLGVDAELRVDGLVVAAVDAVELQNETFRHHALPDRGCGLVR